MHTGEFIISFGRQGCDGMSQTWRRVLPLLAKRHTVLHVLPHYYLRNGCPGLVGRMRRSGLRRVSENLYEYQPPWFLPRNYRLPVLDKLVCNIGIRLIARTARSLGCRNPILYLWHPLFAHVAGRFDEKLLCYHVYDDFFGYGGGTPEEISTLQAMDTELLTKADLVFVTTRRLLDRIRGLNRGSHLLPNGADYEEFATAADRVGREPADIAAIKRPRIGYTGNLNAKVDFNLLAYLAEKRPDWSIVLIGPMNASPEKIGRCRFLKNVHFLGERDYSQIPDYVAALDACIMPYEVDGWMVFGYPLKMHEYLAAGKPVVASALESVEDFEEVVAIAHSPDEWLTHLERCLSPDALQDKEARREVARRHSWEGLVADIEELMESRRPRADRPHSETRKRVMRRDG